MSLGLFTVPGRDYGQVPGLDRDSDRRADWLTPKTDSVSPSLMTSIVKRAAGTAQNEVTFRQMVMQEMLERSMSGPIRRRVMDAAVTFYRGLRPDPSLGRHNTQVPRQLPAREAAFMMTPTPESSYGQADPFSERLIPERLIVKGFLSKANPEQLPRGGSSNDVLSDPVGTRKVWNRRIVEKKTDGQWHVVGHVPGLEDPKKVKNDDDDKDPGGNANNLDTSKLDRKNVVSLLHQLLRVKRAHESKV